MIEQQNIRKRSNASSNYQESTGDESNGDLQNTINLGDYGKTQELIAKQYQMEQQLLFRNKILIQGFFQEMIPELKNQITKDLYSVLNAQPQNQQQNQSPIKVNLNLSNSSTQSNQNNNYNVPNIPSIFQILETESKLKDEMLIQKFQHYDSKIQNIELKTQFSLEQQKNDYSTQINKLKEDSTTFQLIVNDHVENIQEKFKKLEDDIKKSLNKGGQKSSLFYQKNNLIEYDQFQQNIIDIIDKFEKKYDEVSSTNKSLVKITNNMTEKILQLKSVFKKAQDDILFISNHQKQKDQQIEGFQDQSIQQINKIEKIYENIQIQINQLIQQQNLKQQLNNNNFNDSLNGKFNLINNIQKEKSQNGQNLQKLINMEYNQQNGKAGNLVFNLQNNNKGFDQKDYKMVNLNINTNLNLNQNDEQNDKIEQIQSPTNKFQQLQQLISNFPVYESITSPLIENRQPLKEFRESDTQKALIQQKLQQMQLKQDQDFETQYSENSQQTNNFSNFASNISNTNQINNNLNQSNQKNIQQNFQFTNKPQYPLKQQTSDSPTNNNSQQNKPLIYQQKKFSQCQVAALNSQFNFDLQNEKEISINNVESQKNQLSKQFQTIEQQKNMILNKTQQNYEKSDSDEIYSDSDGNIFLNDEIPDDILVNQNNKLQKKSQNFQFKQKEVKDTEPSSLNKPENFQTFNNIRNSSEIEQIDLKNSNDFNVNSTANNNNSTLNTNSIFISNKDTQLDLENQQNDRLFNRSYSQLAQQGIQDTEFLRNYCNQENDEIQYMTESSMGNSAKFNQNNDIVEYGKSRSNTIDENYQTLFQNTQNKNEENLQIVREERQKSYYLKQNLEQDGLISIKGVYIDQDFFLDDEFYLIDKNGNHVLNDMKQKIQITEEDQHDLSKQGVIEREEMDFH